MAKFHLDRLHRKFGWTRGRNYRGLMTDIIDLNSLSLARATGRISKQNFQKTADRVSTRETRLLIPDVSEAIPKRSVFARKAAQDGKLLTDKLRDRVTKSLRATFTEFSPTTGEPAYQFRGGAKKGRTNPKLVARFEASITKDFRNYTRVDPSYGVPPNIHGIAVTEVRSVADEMKWQYAKTIQKKNPDFTIRKRWRHNKSLSEEPRPHHMAADGTTVGFDEAFELSNGARLMYPHDPAAEAEEVIGCHCDYDVLIQRLTQ